MPRVRFSLGYTGYGKENIGRNSKFLQGEETEGYMVEEIMHALQQHEPLCCKLHNHKADGRKFQNLLCLHPVLGQEGEYLYQVSCRKYRPCCDPGREKERDEGEASFHAASMFFAQPPTTMRH